MSIKTKIYQIAGKAGEDGVGISSIEQITTSTADSGVNIFRITLTDNSIYDVEVRNGSKGSTGATGPQGPQGDKGDKGDVGPQGPQGDKGDTGESGITSPVNGFFTMTVDEDGGLYVISTEDGSTPHFEYDTESGNLYVLQGDVRTLLGNAKGPKGDTGATGPQGEKGEQGPKGDTGATGPKGDTGATGPQGEKGDKGDTGATGSDASVTKANITSALGYTPANPNTVPSNKETWTFTLEDGTTVTKNVYIG